MIISWRPFLNVINSWASSIHLKICSSLTFSPSKIYDSCLPSWITKMNELEWFVRWNFYCFCICFKSFYTTGSSYCINIHHLDDIIQVITIVCGTDNLMKNIPHLLSEYGEYFVEYCQSHKTLLWIWMMLCTHKINSYDWVYLERGRGT